MENLKTTEKVNKITKLISQASFIRKQMNYGMENFHIINDMLFDKISEALDINSTIEDVPTMLECSNRINNVHKIKIQD
jgi:hypothetical protein